MENPERRHRLRHNLLPLDAERDIIVESLHVGQAEISKIDRANPSEGSAARKLALREYITECSSLLSPIRRLPQEIMQAIFLDPEIHGHLSTGWRSYTVDGHTPHLAAVCFHWRCAALEMPQFWASIYTSLTGTPNSLSLLRLFMRRSKGAFLSIKLQSVDERILNPDVMDELLQESHRWRHLCLPHMDARCIQFLELVTKPPHILQTLTFTSWSIKSTAGVSAFRYASSLCALSFSALDSEDLDRIPHLPCNQIVDLSLDLVKGELCETILVLFPNLQHLRLGTSTPTEPFPRGRSPHKSRLSALVLYGDDRRDSGSVLDVLNFMTLPLLTRLDIIACAVWDCESLRSFQERSNFHHLKALTLRDTRVRGIDLFELLRALPTLETLIMLDLLPNAITDPFLAGLVSNLAIHPEGEDLRILPALTKIVLEGAYLCSMNMLLTVLESRLSSNDSDSSNANNPYSLLTYIQIILEVRSVSVSELDRFAALRCNFFNLECLDESLQLIRICNGRRR
ncbi:hypothetical protein C8R43DRAFT_954647 [Mycena crocata]|nr:hypothetical protein C8R43DRAFT_954647 [Mycena crocata]